MKTRSRTPIAAVLAAALLGAPLMVIIIAFPPVAHAQSAAKAVVDAAKAAGAVGEQADGTLGIVSEADAAIRDAVAEINAGRETAYRDAAARSGVTPVAAGEAAYRQLLGRMPAGQFYRPAGGGWTRK